MDTAIQKISQKITKEDFWRKHCEIYKTSGVSKTAYSRQNNLIASRFIYWSRKFEMSNVEKSKSFQQSNFARIAIKDEKTQCSNIGIHPLCTLELGDKKRLIIHDMTVIKIVLNTLGVN